jgi:hypothetical protein
LILLSKIEPGKTKSGVGYLTPRLH